MKTDVQNNFPVSSLSSASNQNKFEAYVLDGKNENGHISPNNNNNNIFQISPHPEGNRCRRDNAGAAQSDVSNRVYYLPETERSPVYVRRHEPHYRQQQGGANSTNLIKCTRRADVPRARSVVSETPSTSSKSDKPAGRRVGNRRRASEFGVFNPYFTEQNVGGSSAKASATTSSSRVGYISNEACKSVDQKPEGGCLNMPDISSRKEVLNEAISNALSGSDQLINLRELSNAISYSRKFEACNCQSLYDELMFPCVKPTTANVIKNSCAKESHFVLGLPKRKPNFSNDPSSSANESEDKCATGAETKPQAQQSSPNKYILPMPQANNRVRGDEEKVSLTRQESEDSSDNFDKSEYLKFKQIACSGDDFKLKLFFDGMSKNKAPLLQNRSSSFPQTEEVEANPDGSLPSPGRKYSHPTMNFQADAEDVQKGTFLPVKITQMEDTLPLKPVPHYACNIAKPESLPVDQTPSSVLVKNSDLNSYQSPVKSASKRRHDFSMRRGSAPATDVYQLKEKPNNRRDDISAQRLDCPSLWNDFPARKLDCPSLGHRRSTIGPETMAHDLRHMDRWAVPVAKRFDAAASSSKDASLLLRRRSKLFCDGFRSLDQLSSCSASVNSCDGSSSGSSSSDSSSSDSTSCTSSSSWSLSSSSSSESSELF